jgi:hypothetical protein
VQRLTVFSIRHIQPSASISRPPRIVAGHVAGRPQNSLSVPPIPVPV